MLAILYGVQPIDVGHAQGFAGVTHKGLTVRPTVATGDTKINQRPLPKRHTGIIRSLKMNGMIT